MTVAVITACYGGYDVIEVPMKQTVDFVHYTVTDSSIPIPSEGVRSVIHFDNVSNAHPRLCAKQPKFLPFDYIGDDDIDVAVWIDSSFKITQPTWLEWCLDGSQGMVSQLKHPLRDDIFHEAVASAQLPKYFGLPIMDQATHYIDDGHPRGWGLWATGLIVWRRSEAQTDFGHAWLQENVKWTYQDQISEPYVARKLGVNIHTIPGDLWAPTNYIIKNHASEL